MPIYEYTCRSCHAKFEQLVPSMSSSAKVKCPRCASTKTKRELSVFAVGAESARGGASAGAMPDKCQHCEGRGSCAGGFDGD